MTASATLVHYRVLRLLANRLPGADLGTAEQLAQALDTDPDTMVNMLVDLVSARWVTRRSGTGVFFAAWRAGDAFPRVRATVTSEGHGRQR